MTNRTGYIRGICTNPNISVYRHATPAARCPPPAARASLNVTEPSQNRHRTSQIVAKCHSAAVPRAPGGACSPRHARRAAPAARRPRVIECHRTITECHILPQTVTEPPCRARQAAHARQATPAARRPPPGARASLNVTKTTHNVTDCHKMSQSRRATRARRLMLATPRLPRGARRPAPARH